MRSLIRYGLETTGFDDTFCGAVLVLLNMSILPLTVSLLELLLMLPRSFKDFRAFPPVASLDDAPLPCQMQLCVVATLSQHECVGASVTSAEFRRALCQGRLWCESDTDTSWMVQVLMV